MNVMQRGDALALLRSLPDGCTPLVFFDPQYRGVLGKLRYGAAGALGPQPGKGIGDPQTEGAP
jgi:hypothetical protein